jgi:hypothetical protein
MDEGIVHGAGDNTTPVSRLPTNVVNGLLTMFAASTPCAFEHELWRWPWAGRSGIAD